MWIAFKTNSFPLRKRFWTPERPAGQDKLVIIQSFVYPHNNTKPLVAYDANQMCIDCLVGDQLTCAKKYCYLFDKTTSLCIGKYDLSCGGDVEIDTIYEVHFKVEPKFGLRSSPDLKPPEPTDPEASLLKLEIHLTFNYVSKNTHKISDHNVYYSPGLIVIKQTPTIDFDVANDAFFIMTVGTEVLSDIDIGTSYDYFIQRYGTLKS